MMFFNAVFQCSFSMQFFNAVFPAAKKLRIFKGNVFRFTKIEIWQYLYYLVFKIAERSDEVCDKNRLKAIISK